MEILFCHISWNIQKYERQILLCASFVHS
jgi:hypothetical protein